MKVWLQRADFSSTDHELGSSPTIKLVAKHDWQQELAFYRKLQSESADSCAPGLGIIHPSGRILHICPSEESWTSHYHYPRKRFGVFPRADGTITKENYPNAEIPQLILDFFNEQWERFV